MNSKNVFNKRVIAMMMIIEPAIMSGKILSNIPCFLLFVSRKKQITKKRKRKEKWKKNSKSFYLSQGFVYVWDYYIRF